MPSLDWMTLNKTVSYSKIDQITDFLMNKVPSDLIWAVFKATQMSDWVSGINETPTDIKESIYDVFEDVTNDATVLNNLIKLCEWHRKNKSRLWSEAYDLFVILESRDLYTLVSMLKGKTISEIELILRSLLKFAFFCPDPTDDEDIDDLEYFCDPQEVSPISNYFLLKMMEDNNYHPKDKKKIATFCDGLGTLLVEKSRIEDKNQREWGFGHIL